MKLSFEEMIKRAENSSFYKLLNIKIKEIKTNYACLSINIDKRHIQFLKTVHGGVIASLADSAAAWAVYGSDTNLDGSPVTVEMKINFLKPIKSGKLVAEAKNLHKGSKIFVSEVEVKDGKENLIAKSLVTYYIVKEKMPSKKLTS